MRPQSRLLASAVTAALVLSSVACTSGEPTDPQPSSPAATVTPTPTPSPTPTPTPTPSPTRKAPGDPLTGLRFSSNGVYAVKIDNVAPARPQVGISKADIIVAEEVEASLTRLVAIFHSSFPSAVGPVRSARNTDVEFLPLFGKPGLVYSGANRLVQANVRGSEHLVPIERSDRDYSRPAPHNVVVNLAGIAEQHPVAKASDIGWTFAKSDKRWKDADESGDFSEQVGGDTFSFTRTDDGYHIAVNGDTYDDAATGKNLVATNIVVLSVVNRPDTDTTSSISIVSDTTGEGAVTITRDGKTRTGTWKRESPTAPMTFTDSDGKPINLKPGKTWLLLQG